MTKPAPPLDRRTARDIAQQIRDLLRVYVPQWQETHEYIDRNNQQQLKSDRISLALINIFARFGEIIIRRLNQVPDKNLLAFLDLLGASRLPPQPARVPLTFSLAQGTVVDPIVPAGTQVAAPAGEGATEPTIFETERELFLTAARLTAIFLRDPQQDSYSDRSFLIETDSAAVPVWRGDRASEHIFYIGQEKLLGFAEIENLNLTVEVEQPLGDGGIIAWQIGNGTTWIDLVPINDPSQNFSQIGNHQIEFGRITAIPITEVNQIENRWLRCHLRTPITQALESQTNMVRVSELPTLTNINLQTRLNRTNLAIATAFTNQIAVDLSKDFFPFGERPKFGDTLYLANAEVFSIAGASISLQIELTNPTGLENSPILPTQASEGLQLQFEFWNGQTWFNLNPSSQTEPEALRFTQSGTVQFTLPEDNPPVATTVNGVESFWIRVRIVAGNYGQEARYEFDRIEGNETLYRRIPRDSFAPPSIRSIQLEYSLSATAEPEVILTYNDFIYSEILRPAAESFTRFQLPANSVDRPTVYFGFTLPPNRSLFPNRPITLFKRIADVKFGEKLIPISPNRSQRFGLAEAQVEHEFTITNAASETVDLQIQFLGTRWFTELATAATIRLNPNEETAVRVRVTIPENTALGNRDRGFLKLTKSDEPLTIHTAVFETVVATEPPDEETPRLIWEYFNGQNWQQLIVRDETNAFIRAGIVEFLPPRDISQTTEFDLAPQYWLRVRWERGNYAVEPRWQRILLNTTIARQSVTFRDEILGNSDGTANQIFRTIHSPVLMGQQLEVQEPELPSSTEVEMSEAIAIATEQSGEIWTPWQEVSDFYASTSRDRHYTLNHLTGEIRFGDGRNGLIPPLGTGNIRMTLYHSGGGSLGNQPLGAIAQLTTTVPYVDAVTNTENAAGGAEAEDLDLLRERIPRQIRHRDRAVTVEDYEDLAKQASPAIARAKCVPLYDLNLDSVVELNNAELRRPGVLSLIIIPRDNAPNPSPSLELINRVQDYLDYRSLPTARLVVVGPYYVPVDVEAEIALTSLETANAVEATVQQTLAQFLNPLTGGPDSTGWEFGRQPHKSDFYALLEAIPGIDHIRTLKVPNIIDAGDLFLVYSGNHKINLTF